MAGDDSLRAFVAVAPGEAAREAARRFQRDLAARLPDGGVRWTRPDQWHLTLQFLGQVPAGSIPGLVARLHDALQAQAPFELDLGAPGAFPTIHRPRVVWLGLAGNLTALAALQQRAASACEGAGDPAEPRGFHPHITLGRAIQPDAALGRQLARALGQSAGPSGSTPWRVDAVVLYRSELQPAGARHTELATFPLTAAG